MPNGCSSNCLKRFFEKIGLTPVRWRPWNAQIFINARSEKNIQWISNLFQSNVGNICFRVPRLGQHVLDLSCRPKNDINWLQLVLHRKSDVGSELSTIEITINIAIKDNTVIYSHFIFFVCDKHRTKMPTLLYYWTWHNLSLRKIIRFFRAPKYWKNIGLCMTLTFVLSYHNFLWRKPVRPSYPHTIKKCNVFCVET